MVKPDAQSAGNPGDFRQGWYTAARRVPSPNFDARPPGVPISLIVLHAISLPPECFGGPEVERFFTNTLDPGGHPYFAALENLRVSAHFFLRRDGALQQFVRVDNRAWHAGVSLWQGRACCNDFSVGIELEGSDHHPYTERQYAALWPLIGALLAAYPVTDIAGHQDIAPGRKTDPGPHFDWARLAARFPNLHQPERASFNFGHGNCSFCVDQVSILCTLEKETENQISSLPDEAGSDK